MKNPSSIWRAFRLFLGPLLGSFSGSLAGLVSALVLGVGCPLLGYGKAPSSQAAGVSQEAYSPLDKGLFERLLISEFEVLNGDIPKSFETYQQVARQYPSDAVYARLFQLAVAMNNGKTITDVALEWEKNVPQSGSPKRYLFQIYFNSGAYAQAMVSLKAYLALLGPKDRNDFMLGLNAYFSRVEDKVAAATWLGEALRPYVQVPINRPTARLVQARAWIPAGRIEQALQGLLAASRARPDPELTSVMELWLLQAGLQLELNQRAQAEESLKIFLRIAALKNLPSNNAMYAQAYLSLATLAEERKDYEAARQWLSKIEDEKIRLEVQVKQSHLLAKQGKLEEARRLIQALPETTQAGARAKLLAEVGLLRTHQQYEAAAQLLETALQAQPKEVDLLYELSIVRERQKNYAEMERLLTLAMSLSPGNASYYNALGYSLAERGVRLEEAQSLIERALQLTPGDPYITDSLGWVAFKANRLDDALKILQGAYKTKPDAEIAAHWGEVLWRMGRLAEAREIWKAAQALNPENETLVETMQRLAR